MAVELKPLGNSCNLNCVYCYQEPMRKAGNERSYKTYDIDLMLEIAEKSDKGKPVVFGGEGLLVPIKDLEKIFKFGYEKYGGSGIQTNGSLVTDKHIELFKKYNVHVGVSVDGPGELNELRKSKTNNKSTEELTEMSINNIKKMINAGVRVGIIITLHKLNGSKERLPRLLNFIRWLGNIGVKNGNIHMLEVDSNIVYNKYLLSEEENKYAFLKLAEFFDKEENKDLNYIPFTEIEDMQRGKSSKSCVWKSCDPTNTQSVYGIEGNGSISNCGMVNKEGIEWYKAETQTFIRDVLLYQTPHELGGCKDCPYFLMCNGYCPGSSIQGDWRNKTIHCGTLKALFQYYENKIEKEGLTPFSKIEFRKELEKIYINNLINFNNRVGLSKLIELYKNKK